MVTRTLPAGRPARAFHASTARITAATMQSLSDTPSADAAVRRRSVEAGVNSIHM